jgi:hypothetical protein
MQFYQHYFSFYRPTIFSESSHNLFEVSSSRAALDGVFSAQSLKKSNKYTVNKHYIYLYC